VETFASRRVVSKPKQYVESSGAYQQLLSRFPEPTGSMRFISQWREPVEQTAWRKGHGASAGERSQTRPARGGVFYRRKRCVGQVRSAESSTIDGSIIKPVQDEGLGQRSSLQSRGILEQQDATAEAAARYRQLLALYPKRPIRAEASYNLVGSPTVQRTMRMRLGFSNSISQLTVTRKRSSSG